MKIRTSCGSLQNAAAKPIKVKDVWIRVRGIGPAKLSAKVGKLEHTAIMSAVCVVTQARSWLKDFLGLM